MNSSEFEQKVINQWSECLFDKELVPRNYQELSDEILLANFH